MTFRTIAFALTATAAIVAAAAPASARPAADHVDAGVRSTVCTRDVGSVACGRYQQQRLQATALRAGAHLDAATIHANGQRQLNELIDSIS